VSSSLESSEYNRLLLTSYPPKRWISGLNNIFYMFSTLICVFTLDRIGRRYTL
jgi:hypothetical protein